MGEKLVIEINMPDNETSIVDQIDALMAIPKAPPKKSKYVETTDDLHLSSIKTKKKDKKKKKKKSLLSDTFLAESSEDEINKVVNSKEMDMLLDVDELLKERDEDERGIDDDIIGKGKSSYKKLKKHENDFKKEFADEITLLYALLDESSKLSKALEKDYNDIRGSKTRGISKYSNELGELVLSSKKSRLDVIKEIVAIKKTIADLKIKADGKKTADDSDKSPERLASAYFKQLLQHGRVGGNKGNFMDDDDEEEFLSRDVMLSGGYYDDHDEIPMSITDKLETRLQNEPGLRSEEGTKYIEYENRGVKIYVKKCIDTGEWEFIALDKNEQQIDDYPLPTKKSAGRMKFSDDGTYCTDSLSRMYKVIEYYLPDEDHMYDEDDED